MPGCAVMAGIAAPVLEEQPWRSSGCEMHLREAGGSRGPWRPYSASTTVFLSDVEGPHVVEAEYRLDGEAPIGVYGRHLRRQVPPRAEGAARRRGAPRQAGAPALPGRRRPSRAARAATVTVTVTTRAGRVLRTFVRRLVPVGLPASVHVHRRPRKGRLPVRGLGTRRGRQPDARAGQRSPHCALSTPATPGPAAPCGAAGQLLAGQSSCSHRARSAALGSSTTGTPCAKQRIPNRRPSRCSTLARVAAGSSWNAGLMKCRPASSR